MLAELRRAHADLLACIEELEQLAREDAPDRARLAKIRWKLSRASGARRKLVAAAHAQLSTALSGPDRERLATLMEEGAQSVAQSSHHVGRWTVDAIMVDWDGYRAASEAMRRTMRARIRSEQRALYPLLERATRA